MAKRIGFLISHPIQYYAPIFRELAKRCDLTVFFAHRQTAEQQARAGFGVAFDWDIDLLSGYDSRFLTNVARQPSTDRFAGCDTPGIAEEIARGGFDAFIVPGWALRSYWQAVRACRRRGVPVLVRGDSQLGGQRNNAIRIAKALAFSQLLRRFDGFLYVGQRNREYLLHYGVPAERLFFSPHCVDNDAFAAASSGIRRPEGRRRVLFVGKLIGRKHPADLLHAVARLRDKSLQIAFAGAGELESELRKIAAASSVDADFMGFVNQSELPAVYASADLLVLPSDGQETWGLVVNEAMACGVPAVVSDVVGCGPDLIEAGRTGEMFAFGDTAPLAAAIRNVLSFDPEQTRRHLAAKMAVYSPARAAGAVVDAATTLAANGRLQ
ncbi:Glycosyltransferase involved in cell wall bisynthesis [Rhodospirillales bacterium URHD0017]|nr:Glycosyltransferase involved in cell wall bisynthesis [Rhodospirillales bacterium URHD0017]